MPVEFTKAQKAAINEQGSILVSAAAGSGKTAVLVERIISAVCRTENPVSIDKLLVVTFTNSAAAELKVRIQRRLQAESQQHPENRWIKRQLLLLPGAKICTIDAFCIDLVRDNFEALCISPDFKILDNATLAALYSKAADILTNKHYEAQDQEFLNLLNGIGADYGDLNLTNVVHNLYLYSSLMPFSNEWLDKCVNYYKQSITDINDTFWSDKAYSIALDALTDAYNMLDVAKEVILQDDNVKEKHGNNFIDYKNAVDTLLLFVKNKQWDKIFEFVNTFKASTRKSISDSSNNQVVQYIGCATKAAQNAIEKLKKIFYTDAKTAILHLNISGEFVKTLVCLVKEYADIVYELMCSENAFTFSNIESMAIKLLCKSADGEILFTNTANEMCDRFYEVLVDEYQDVNNLQDMLFYILSDRAKKLFIVGDIKQSIYRFRGANPNNFMYKKNTYIDYLESVNSEHKKIILSNNFRSRKGICDYINFFFAQLMNKKDAEIDYNGEEMLNPSAEFEDNCVNDVQIHLLCEKDTKDSYIESQAEHIARYILKTINDEPFLRGKNGLRQAEFSDFCILLRAPKDKQEPLVNVLKKHSIPVSVGINSFAESSEVVTFMSMLRVIDNPTRDVSLLSAMMSPIFRFTAEEIAQIRTSFKDTTLYGAVCAAANSGNEKCKGFINEISYFRRLSVTMTVEKFIAKLFDVTGYMNIVYSMSDPQLRRKNCLKILKYAAEFDEFSQTGLSGFLSMFDRVIAHDKSSQDAKAVGSGVKIMSIHASKGLQFPICIIVDMEKSFNISDATGILCKSENLGIALKYIDYQNNVKVNSLSHIIIGEDIKVSQIAEELRLIYVAMTRAEERLVLVSSVPKLDEKLVNAAAIQYLEQNANSKSLNAAVKFASSYCDWLINTAMLHPTASKLRERALNIPIVPIETNADIDVEICTSDSIQLQHKHYSDNTTFEKMDVDFAEIFSYKYPFAALRNIEAKTSVSNLVHNTKTMSDFNFLDRPAFLSDSGFSAAEKGTVLHKFMELADYKAAKEDLESEIYRLVDYKFITKQQANILDRNKIKQFFESNLYKRISLSGLVKHEMQFLSEVPAAKIVPDINESLHHEKIIIQGAVDLVFEEDGEIVIVDFKTDRISDIGKLKELYAEQLNYYAYSCEKIFKKPIKQKIIYSLYNSCEIIV